jgi:hypothetical protein
MKLETIASFKKELKLQNLQSHGSLAGNAGLTVVETIPVPVNGQVYVNLYAKLAAGTITTKTITAIDATADTATIVAHGFVTGSPVFVTVTGLTAGTVYYARAEDVDTLTFYDTKAHALAGGATGLGNITALGSGPKVVGTIEQGFYQVKAVVRNRNGKTALLGAQSQALALEDVAAWDVSITANDTTDVVELNVTPDATLATRWELTVESSSEGSDV